jgi:hypothetical protein
MACRHTFLSVVRDAIVEFSWQHREIMQAWTPREARAWRGKVTLEARGDSGAGFFEMPLFPNGWILLGLAGRCG